MNLALGVCPSDIDTAREKQNWQRLEGVAIRSPGSNRVKFLRGPLIDGESKDERAHRLFLAWRERNRDRMRRYYREYAARNRAKRRANWKKHYRLNTAKVRARIAVYRSKNVEKRRLAAKHYDARPERRAARAISSKRWLKKHPEVTREMHVRRKARIRGAAVDGRVKTLIRRWKRDKFFTCYYCKSRFSSSRLHVDHIVPISKGGEHSPKNVCRSCDDCNLKKYNHPVGELAPNGQTLLSI